MHRRHAKERRGVGGGGGIRCVKKVVTVMTEAKEVNPITDYLYTSLLFEQTTMSTFFFPRVSSSSVAVGTFLEAGGAVFK